MQWVSEVAQKVLCRESNYPEGTLRPEKRQRMGSGPKRGRFGLGCAQAPAEEGRQGHGCSRGRGRPGEGNVASSRGRKEQGNLMAVTNEQQAQITDRKRKRSAGGGQGSQLPKRLRAAAPATAPQSKGAQASKLITVCWKENQNDRKATLHVGCDPALAVVSTKLPIQLRGLPVRREEPGDNPWEEELRECVTDPFKG